MPIPRVPCGSSCLPPPKSPNSPRGEAAEQTAGKEFWIEVTCKGGLHTQLLVCLAWETGLIGAQDHALLGEGEKGEVIFSNMLSIPGSDRPGNEYNLLEVDTGEGSGRQRAGLAGERCGKRRGSFLAAGVRSFPPSLACGS